MITSITSTKTGALGPWLPKTPLAPEDSRPEMAGSICIAAMSRSRCGPSAPATALSGTQGSALPAIGDQIAPELLAHELLRQLAHGATPARPTAWPTP